LFEDQQADTMFAEAWVLRGTIREVAAILMAIKALAQGRILHDIPEELELFSVGQLTSCFEVLSSA